MCEDPRLRRRRRAPPLGELRVPLRKLVPNQARSFDVCLEKRKLVSGADTAWRGDQDPGGGEAGEGWSEEGDPGQCLAKVTKISAPSDQEAQEPGHRPWHVPV